jgi:hypothetical protein
MEIRDQSIEPAAFLRGSRSPVCLVKAYPAGCDQWLLNINTLSLLAVDVAAYRAASPQEEVRIVALVRRLLLAETPSRRRLSPAEVRWLVERPARLASLSDWIAVVDHRVVIQPAALCLALSPQGLVRWRFLPERDDAHARTGFEEDLLVAAGAIARVSSLRGFGAVVQPQQPFPHHRSVYLRQCRRTSAS